METWHHDSMHRCERHPEAISEPVWMSSRSTLGVSKPWMFCNNQPVRKELASASVICRQALRCTVVLARDTCTHCLKILELILQPLLHFDRRVLFIVWLRQ